VGLEGDKMKRALYIGKFQPFHIGHRDVVKYIASQPDIDEIVIHIGCGQWNYNNPNPDRTPLENPFTREQRKEMVLKTLADEINKPVHIFHIDDILPIRDPSTIYRWRDKFMAEAPDFDVFYCNRETTAKVFRELGKEIRPFERDYQFSATFIREKIARGEAWEPMVPKQTAKIIKRDGMERIITGLYADCPVPENSEWTYFAATDKIPGLEWNFVDERIDTMIFSAIATQADLRVKNNKLSAERVWAVADGIEARQTIEIPFPIENSELSEVYSWLKFPLGVDTSLYSENISQYEFTSWMPTELSPNLMAMELPLGLFTAWDERFGIYGELEYYGDASIYRLMSDDRDGLLRFVERHGLKRGLNPCQMLERRMIDYHGSDFWDLLKVSKNDNI